MRLLRFVPMLAAFIALLFFLSLGQWQLNRAAEKQSILDRVDASSGRSVKLINSLSGALSFYERAEVHADQQLTLDLLLDAQVSEGQVGYHALSAIAVDDGVVLVNLGWIAADAELDKLALPAKISGIWSPLPAAGMQMGKVLVGKRNGVPIVNYPTVSEYAELTGKSLANGILLADPDPAGVFVRKWRPAGFGPDRHYGYAFTWFSLAATVVIVFLLLMFRRSSS